MFISLESGSILGKSRPKKISWILEDHSLRPFGEEVWNALTGSEDVLKQVLDSPEDVDSAEIPVKAWIDEYQDDDYLHALIPYTGNLTVIECAQISNWFEEKIALGDQKICYKWIGSLSIVHTFTIFIVSHIPETASLYYVEGTKLATAWDLQLNGVIKLWDQVLHVLL